MPDYGNVLVKVAVSLGVINRVPAAIPEHNVFCYSTVAHILTPSVNLVFGPKSGLKNKCRVEPGSGLLFRAPAGFRLKNEALLQLFVGVYACRGQQGEIEWMHPPPAITSSSVPINCMIVMSFSTRFTWRRRTWWIKHDQKTNWCFNCVKIAQAKRNNCDVLYFVMITTNSTKRSEWSETAWICKHGS